MLLSMTGYGDARRQTDRLNVAVEVRAVNNRYLKVMTKCPEAYAPVELEIEKVVRESVGRGTVSVTVRVRTLGGRQQFDLDRDVLENYWRQLNHLADSIHLAVPTDLGSLLQLPGLVVEVERDPSDCQSDWPVICETLRKALGKLHEFRSAEGASMQRNLQTNARVVTDDLEKVASLTPQVVVEYRDRILQRVRELLDRTDVTVDESNLLREVSIFADRCDINEEITRMRSHLHQFESFLHQESSQGRKLEFLVQEMFREVNTIGTKANNVSIAHCVVKMKATIEKIREILQNVE